MNYTRLSLLQLVRGLKDGSIDLMEYIDQALELLESNDRQIGAFLPETGRRERIEQKAKALIDRHPQCASRPPLFGVLVGVKDLYNVEGMPTRAGSKLPASAFYGQEAALVSILRQKGAIVLGKTVSTEFAYFDPGQTRNPCNTEHSPGGSSSGSAAAVAMGYCPIALGTQTIASIIRPSSYCGVYGFKPSWGRVSLEGVFPFSQSADHAGWICSSLSGLAYFAQVVMGVENMEQIAQPKLALADGAYFLQADSACRDNTHAALERLSRKGIKVVEHDFFGDIEAVNAEHRKLIAAEFAMNHKELFAVYGDLYSKHSQELILQGTLVSESELQDLRNNQLILRKSIINQMQQTGAELIVSPATTTTAPRGIESTGSPLMSLPWTNAGLPSLTIPTGMDENGLPFGMQVTAPFGFDEYLLAAASWLI